MCVIWSHPSPEERTFSVPYCEEGIPLFFYRGLISSATQIVAARGGVFKFILHLEGTCYLLPPTFLLFPFLICLFLFSCGSINSRIEFWTVTSGPRKIPWCVEQRRSNFISVKCFAKSLVSTQKRTSSCPSIIGTTMQFNGYSFLSLLNEKRQVIVPYGVPACSHACSIRSCMCFLS